MENLKENIWSWVFFKYLIKNPFVSTLLMVVYDNEEKGVNKRNILNNEYKYIEVVHILWIFIKYYLIFIKLLEL